MWQINDPAFKRRGDYDFFEVAKLIPYKQVHSNPVRVRFKTPCYVFHLRPEFKMWNMFSTSELLNIGSKYFT